jgi:hypothetical protein
MVRVARAFLTIHYHVSPERRDTIEYVGDIQVDI